jgi:hypothetical protein
VILVVLVVVWLACLRNRGMHAAVFVHDPAQAPGLAVVIVGDRQDSQTYVNMKQKACEEVGIRSFDARLPASVSQPELLSIVRGFNDNPDVHGILVQLPVSDAALLGVMALSRSHRWFGEQASACGFLLMISLSAGCSCRHTLMRLRSWAPSASTRTWMASIQ